MSQQQRGRPTGRRTGDSGTRDAILDAALTLFAERGYDAASVRAIAESAGVDPALIRHFFGDKNTLFATVVADRTSIPARLGAALDGDPSTLGARVADAYLRLWEDPQTRPTLLALVRSATTSPHAADMLRDLLAGRAPALAPDKAQGTALAASHLFGIAFTRHIIKLPAITACDHDTLVAAVAPTIQHYLTADQQTASTNAR
ncbi:MAG: TetR family transcriptional regulator [Micrococcales bacterium]|nr:TetR family transcriptional regulator [Micrococcales bacterium]MCL2667420.1 TetR family transcriptional regulator [Micrococcales bacterium]